MNTATYMHAGIYPNHLDAFALHDGEPLYAAVCDGAFQGEGRPDEAADCARMVVQSLQRDLLPNDALGERYSSLLGQNSILSAVCVMVAQGRCAYSSLGNARLYHFAQGELRHHSRDDSFAFIQYENGSLAYEDIRLHPDAQRLTAWLGGDGNTPHGKHFEVKEGDALLLCTDGFWQYVYETEMLVDLLKSAHVQDWLDAMLLRVVERNRLNGDSLTAIAILV